MFSLLSMLVLNSRDLLKKQTHLIFAPQTRLTMHKFQNFSMSLTTNFGFCTGTMLL